MSHARSFIALAALASVSIVACAAGTEPASTADAGTLPNTPTVEAGAATPATTDFQVRTDTRAAWLSLAQWTHSYAVAVIDGGGEQQAFDRLTATGDDFATQTGSLLGDGAAAQLTTLMNERTKMVFAFVGAAKKGADLGPHEDAWQKGTSDLAAFFTSELGSAHAITAIHTELVALDQATQDAIVARVKGDVAAEVKAADLADQDALEVGDTLGNALVATYRGDLATSTLSGEDQSLRLELRSELAQSAYWLRAFAIDQMKNRPAQPELDRAIAFAVAVSDVFGRFYGSTVGGQVEFGLHSQIADSYAYLLAAESGGDSTVLASTRQVLVTDTHHFAELLAGINPTWTTADLDRILQTGVDRTLADLDAQRAGQFDAEAADWQMVLDNSRELGDVLADGLAKAFPSAPH